MATSGAQPGNQNAARGKAFLAALRRVLAEYGESEGVDGGIRKLAKKLAEAALEKGEQWAIQEIANRLDGKPPQALHVTSEDGTSDLVEVLRDLAARLPV